MDGLVPGWSGLPVRLTRFFGRETEVAELQEAVERHRLVTLVGAPGCGKTRLATEVASVFGRYRLVDAGLATDAEIDEGTAPFHDGASDLSVFTPILVSARGQRGS